jgi:signal transduction histidine kinase
MQEAKKSEQLTNNFLMVASHELRTPLTAVQGYLELLTTYAKTLDDETKQHFVDLASHACEELVLLLGNVMDTSRIDYERMHLQIERVHLRMAMRSIVEILEPAFSMEKRTLQTDIDEHLYVQADDLRLRQILLNLVGNALKYAPSSDVAITATSTERENVEQCLDTAHLVLPATSTTSHFVLLGVRDWGNGIAQEDMSRLFTKFGRLESAINSMQRGAGLGLYLCRQLAEAMHGQIWAESSGIEGEGVTFFVALPLG